MLYVSFLLCAHVGFYRALLGLYVWMGLRHVRLSVAGVFGYLLCCHCVSHENEQIQFHKLFFNSSSNSKCWYFSIHKCFQILIPNVSNVVGMCFSHILRHYEIPYPYMIGNQLSKFEICPRLAEIKLIKNDVLWTLIWATGFSLTLLSLTNQSHSFNLEITKF